VNDRIVELKLNREQTDVIGPLVREATSNRLNVLFVSSFAPDIEAGQPVWRWQIKMIKSTAARRVLKVIKDAGKEDADCTIGK
jgi:hypothetical protein